MLKSFYIFFLYKNKPKTFRYRGISKKEAINELQYLYGKDIVIKGVRSKILEY